MQKNYQSIPFLREILPWQQMGGQFQTLSNRTFNNAEKSLAAFVRLKHLLAQPDLWHANVSHLGAEFFVCDEKGIPRGGPATSKSVLRVDFPAYKSRGTMLSFWMKVDGINEFQWKGQLVFQLTLRPCPDPRKPGRRVCNYLTADATTTLVATHHDRNVTLHVIGRNEMANWDAPLLQDRLRNLFLNLREVAGLSPIRWKRLARDLITLSTKEKPEAEYKFPFSGANTRTEALAHRPEQD